jgi:hypothetical protein
MIDIRKALSQRCYIIFDTNEQLRNFFEDNKLTPYMGIFDDETILSVHDDKELVTLSTARFGNTPRYHHSELTITDDGE